MATLKVCKYFIKSAPVGELHEVLDDIQKVLGGSADFLTAPEVKEALREYYETHKLHVTFANGETALVAPHGRQEPIYKYSQSATAQVPVLPKTVAAAPVKKGGLFDGDDDEDEYGVEKQPVEPAYQEDEQQQQEYEQPVEQSAPVVESVEEFVYYDPVKKVKFSFDPLTLEARIEEENVDWETVTLSPDVVQLR
jgi:hypothetical protein